MSSCSNSTPQSSTSSVYISDDSTNNSPVHGASASSLANLAAPIASPQSSTQTSHTPAPSTERVRFTFLRGQDPSMSTLFLAAFGMPHARQAVVSAEAQARAELARQAQLRVISSPSQNTATVSATPVAAALSSPATNSIT